MGEAFDWPVPVTIMLSLAFGITVSVIGNKMLFQNAEFIDGNGQAWDIKSFNSNYKPNKGGFRLDKAMNTIKKSLDENENVIVDTSNMSQIISLN